MAKDYFQSREFKDLLKSYEDQQAAGEGIYLDADDFADIADYYLSMDKPSSSMETLATGLSLHPKRRGVVDCVECCLHLPASI